MVLNNEIYELYHKNVVKFPTPYWRDISYLVIPKDF